MNTSNTETWRIVERSLRRRQRAERRFRAFGLCAIGFATLCVAVLLISICVKAAGAFTQSYITLEINLDARTLNIPAKLIVIGDGESGESDAKVNSDSAITAALKTANYRAVLRDALRAHFPAATGRKARREMLALLSPQAEFDLRDMLLNDSALIGTTINFNALASADADIQYRRFHGSGENFPRLSETQVNMLTRLIELKNVSTKFNTRFFSGGDSRDPETAGVLGAVVGSTFTMVVVALLSFPAGVFAAVHLEEFAARSRWVDLIEVNINNLAAVPSIIFGLLGLAVFLNLAGLPRSAPLVGGLVLSLMTLPTVIISARAAIKSVPASIREAALAMGASRVQMVFHHVVPAAMPGILTGAIIGMARALGETAPLLMIGMVAFIVEVPRGLLDPATTLPVQIFLWADSPERAFVERTSAAIVVLLGFLFLMNMSAVYLRRKFEIRW